MIWRLFLAALAIVLGLWLRRRREHFRFFQRLGIPGPKPNLLFGNLHEVYLKNSLWAVNDWHRKFGPVVGLFYGKDPVLLVSDPTVLRQVLTDDFDKFTDRSAMFNVSGVPNSVSCLGGADWHLLRKKLSQVYDKTNIRKLSPVILSCVDELLANVKRECGDGQLEFDVSHLFEAFSLDVICRVALGLNYRIQSQAQHNPLLRFVRDQLKPPLGLADVATISLPVLASVAKRVSGLMQLCFNGSEQQLTPIQELHGDCLQRVKRLRANKREAKGADFLEEILCGIRPVSEMQAVDSAILNILTGYETTSSALCFITNMLIRYPEVQDRLRKELKEASIGSSASLGPERLEECQYLNAVIKETLRMYPPVYMFTTRVSSEPADFQGKLRIPVGLTVMASTREMHYNEDLWPEPEMFNPDRFIISNGARKEDIWLPFGSGPRKCLGQEFALQVIRMVLSRFMLSYRVDTFEYLPHSRVELLANPGLLKLKNGLRCRASPL